MWRPSSDAYRELKEQFDIGWPISLGMLLMRSFSVVSMVMVGYYCSTELFAATSLGTTFANVTGHSIMAGLSSAQATIASQAFGAGDYRRMNETLGRSTVVLLGACVPITVLWFWSEQFLLLCNQSPEVSKAAAEFLIAFIPSLWLYALLQVAQTWLQAQGITKPIAVTSGIAAGLHLLINFVMIKYMELKHRGAAFSNAVTQLIWLVMLVAYTIKAGYASAVGLTFSRHIVKASFRHLLPFMKLAIPGLLMIAEWWAAESIILLGGMLHDRPTVMVSTLSIYQTVNAVAYMVDYGVHVAANTRVGNELGAGFASRAQLASRIAPCFALALSASMGIILHTLRDYYPLAFTRDPEVLEMTKRTALVGSFLITADGVQAACTGVLKGSGRQMIGSVSTLLSYFGVGIPVAVALAFTHKMGAVGLCIGLAVGCYVYMLSTLVLVLLTDWEKEVDKARTRLNIQYAVSVRSLGPMVSGSAGSSIDSHTPGSGSRGANRAGKADLEAAWSRDLAGDEGKVLCEAEDEVSTSAPTVVIDPFGSQESNMQVPHMGPLSSQGSEGSRMLVIGRSHSHRYAEIVENVGVVPVPLDEKAVAPRGREAVS